MTDSAPIPRLGLLLGGLLVLLAWLGWHATASGEAALSWPLAAALAAAFVLGVTAGLLPGRRRQRAIAQEQRALAGAGQDLLARIGTDRIAAPADPALRPLADLLNTFADHRQAQLDRVSDRDNQLALTRRLTGWMYWEQDVEGRYTRLETETEEQSLLARSLLGRTRWECGGIQLGRSIAGAAANPAPDSQWLAHREQLARGKTFSEMVWSVPIDANRRVFIVESGRPRADQDGRIIGYSGLIRDVGGALAAERATQNLMTALRVAPEPTLLIEATPGLPGWRVRWSNAAACAMLGRTDSEILTASPDTLFGGDNRACIEAIGGALASGRGVRLESELADRYGQTRTASIRIDPVLPLEGLQPQAALSIDYFHAETERLREQAGSAHRLLSEQSARLSELEQASRELESFSYTVSHDLRAPLRVVDGFARILKDDFSASLDPTGHDHLNRILTAASRMNQMIDSLLSLARVSSQPIVPGPVDLSLLAQQIVDELRGQRRPNAAAHRAREPAEQRLEIHRAHRSRHHRIRLCPRRRKHRLPGERQRRRIRHALRRPAVRHLPAPAQRQRIPRHRCGAGHCGPDRAAPPWAYLGRERTRRRGTLSIHAQRAAGVATGALSPGAPA
ncbi:MAG: hypothetical protein NTV19_14830 [Burkholderiales bacterium]|nr:hypothetical protein [Burkholderiales bacterium]